MYFYTNPFNRFNSLLDEVMGHPLRELDKISIFDKSSSYSPVETEDSHTIEISVPGFSKKDINVELNEGVLTISAEIEEEDQTKYRKSFSRSYYLPSNINADSCKATMENGILTVSFEKEVKSKKISIK